MKTIEDVLEKFDDYYGDLLIPDSKFDVEDIKQFLRREVTEVLEGLRMKGKPPVAEWEGGKTYDTEQDEGYDQAVKELNAKTRAFIDGWNERAHPFVWTKTPEEILKKANPKKTSETDH